MQQNGMFLNFNIYKKCESSKKGLQQIQKIELKGKINLHKLKNIINTIRAEMMHGQNHEKHT
jgi:hypothetical protein